MQLHTHYRLLADRLRRAKLITANTDSEFLVQSYTAMGKLQSILLYYRLRLGTQRCQGNLPLVSHTRTLTCRATNTQTLYVLMSPRHLTYTISNRWPGDLWLTLTSQSVNRWPITDIKRSGFQRFVFIILALSKIVFVVVLSVLCNKGFVLPYGL